MLAALPLVLSLAAALPCRAFDVEPPQAAAQAERAERAAAIQQGVLDPLLGPGRSHVFVFGSLSAVSGRKSSVRSGEGTARGGDSKRGSSTQSQLAKQSKEDADDSVTWTFSLKDERVVVLYDAALSRATVAAARASLLAVYAGELPDNSLRFVAAPFRPPRPMR